MERENWFFNRVIRGVKVSGSDDEAAGIWAQVHHRREFYTKAVSNVNHWHDVADTA